MRTDETMMRDTPWSKDEQQNKTEPQTNSSKAVCTNRTSRLGSIYGGIFMVAMQVNTSHEIKREQYNKTATQYLLISIWFSLPMIHFCCPSRCCCTDWLALHLVWSWWSRIYCAVIRNLKTPMMHLHKKRIITSASIFSLSTALFKFLVALVEWIV